VAVEQFLNVLRFRVIAGIHCEAYSLETISF